MSGAKCQEGGSSVGQVSNEKLEKTDETKYVLRDIVFFAKKIAGIRLRNYQIEVARGVVDSVFHEKGLTFVVMFPRQSGKNELQAQLETYLLTLLSRDPAEIVKISPTFRPQTQNAMRRLQRVLQRDWIIGFQYTKENGYVYKVGQARIFFLSGSPSSNVVGATASTLLECDEAQDVLIAKWDKDVAPMAASTNATRVFWGTAWTSRTLLARELRAAREAEQTDGIRRVFVLTADDVRKEVPAYGKFVDEQIKKLGRNHPLVRTQYFSEEIDAEGGMFSAARRARMAGTHAPMNGPAVNGVYALLLDVAGEDEGAVDSDSMESGLLRGGGSAANLHTKRDSTALTVVEVDFSTLTDDLIAAPLYRVVMRYAWTGTKHTALYGQIKALAELWQAKYLVVDATGVGAGLASFLDKALPGRVIPYVFSQKSKSDLGWGFLAVIETGRYKEYAAQGWDPFQVEFWQQVENCQSVVLDGPGKLMRWGVPDGTRDPVTGDLVHDDLLLSAALCWVLDAQPWGIAKSAVIKGHDPLAELLEVF